MEAEWSEEGVNRQFVKVVAVDGPAGSGKSTICRQVAERIGWTYLSTGALYRATGILARDLEVDLTSEESLAQFMEDVKAGLRWDGETDRLLFGDRDLTPLLGEEEAGFAASRVAVLPTVRRNLLPLQRDVIRASDAKGALVDGRDIGTVVFPDAELKIFLTASLEERAKRRLAQLGETELTMEAILSDMEARDGQDVAREEAPLKKADDAIEIDTSQMTLDDVVSCIVALLERHELV